MNDDGDVGRASFLDRYLVVYGVGSGVADTTVVGSRIEVPVVLALVNVAGFFQQKFDCRGYTTGRPGSSSGEPTAGGD